MSKFMNGEQQDKKQETREGERQMWLTDSSAHRSATHGVEKQNG